VRLRAKLVGTLIPALAVALAVGIFRSESARIERLRQIIEAGQETQGEVLGRRKTGGKSKNYFVTARYSVDERVYVSEFESREVFDAAPQGSAVVVSYAVDRPSLARLGTRADLSRQRARRQWAQWGAPLLIILAATGFAVFHWRLVRSHLSLARDGVLRWGSVKEVRTFRKNARVTVSVDDGLGAAERNLTASHEFARHQPIGSKAAVLSDPLDPSDFRLCEQVMASVAVDPA
jgi:hypothetical protein